MKNYIKNFEADRYFKRLYIIDSLIAVIYLAITMLNWNKNENIAVIASIIPICVFVFGVFLGQLFTKMYLDYCKDDRNE